ncbi:MAG: caspase family protein, partial [Algicola sp.]|nr:caspase family protein [Algicola sp.]
LGSVPKTDVNLVAEALTHAGYESHNIGPKAKGFGKGEIRTRVYEFLDNSEHSDDLLIYFSGHGVEYQGRRCLVPYDYDPNIAPGIEEMLDDNILK